MSVAAWVRDRASPRSASAASSLILCAAEAGGVLDVAGTPAGSVLVTRGKVAALELSSQFVVQLGVALGTGL